MPDEDEPDLFSVPVWGLAVSEAEDEAEDEPEDVLEAELPAVRYSAEIVMSDVTFVHDNVLHRRKT